MILLLLFRKHCLCWQTTIDLYLYILRFSWILILIALQNQRMALMILGLIQHILSQDRLHGKFVPLMWGGMWQIARIYWPSKFKSSNGVRFNLVDLLSCNVLVLLIILIVLLIWQRMEFIIWHCLSWRWFSQVTSYLYLVAVAA